MNRSLLLISDNPQDQEFAAEVAITSGLSLQSVSDARQGADIFSQEGVAVIFVDGSTVEKYQAFESAIQESVGLFSDKVNANAIHFITASELGRVPYLIQSPVFGHLVLRNYQDPKQCGQHYGRLVKSTLDERAFGLVKLLKNGAKIQVVKLQHSSQKQNAVEAVKNYLLAAKFQSRMATVISNAVDELLMNAVFDAPTDDLGRQSLSATPRTAPVVLQGQSTVEMHVGYDGDCVAISVIDLFGSLDKARLLSHLSKIYTEEEYRVRVAGAGAGIGLATVFRSGGAFFFISEARVRTEVTVFFRRMNSFREFKDQFRFISTQFYF